MNTGRAVWHWRANLVVLAYLAASLGALAARAAGAASTWLPIHLFLLGAATNAIFVWSAHFVGTLLRPTVASRGWLDVRLVVLNVGVVAVLVGVPDDVSWLAVAGAGVVFGSVAAHGVALARAATTARSRRFAVTAWFYLCAGGALLLGVAAGAALSVGAGAGWQPRLLAAHVHLNVFGWVALTVLGTEVTLWPVVLRTRIVEGVETAARHGLMLLVGGLFVAVAGILVDLRVATVVGMVAYAAGVARLMQPFVVTALRQPPRTPAALMLAASAAWLCVAALTDLVAAARSADVTNLSYDIGKFVPWLVAGFVAQVLLGSLSYLVPVVLARGPSGGRRASSVLDFAGVTRTVVLNVGVVLLALPLPDAARRVGWICVGVAIAGFVMLAAGAFVLVGADRRRVTS